MMIESFLYRALQSAYITPAHLDDLEARIDALGPKAYSCTLYGVDLWLLGIPSTHKKRRYIAWTRRKIADARMKIAARVASKITA